MTTTELSRREYADMLTVQATAAAASFPHSVSPERIEKSVERMISAFRQAATNEPKVLQCTPASVCRAIALSAYTDLYPGGPTPDVYILPRWNSRIGATELQWLPSWRGLKRRVERDSGARLDVHLVFEGERFELAHDDRGTRLLHHPKPWGVRTVETLQGGYVRAFDSSTGALLGLVTMSLDEIKQRRDNSDSFKAGLGPWIQWPIEMVRKTLIRYACARDIVPVDERVQHALRADETDAVADAEIVKRSAAVVSEVMSGADALAAHLDEMEGQQGSNEPSAPPTVHPDSPPRDDESST